MFKTLKKVFAGRNSDKEDEASGEDAETDAPEIETAPVVESAPRIRDMYPDVRKIAVNLSSRAPFEKTEPTIRGFSMGPDAIADFVFRCKNTECVNGGFDLNDEIGKMVESYETNSHGRRVCQGWEGKSNIGHQRCYYELNFVMNISYELKNAPGS